MSFTADDFLPRDDTDPYRVKAYQMQPDPMPLGGAPAGAYIPAGVTAGALGIWPPPGSTPGPMTGPNTQTSIRADGTVAPQRPYADPRRDLVDTQTALAVPRAQPQPPQPGVAQVPQPQPGGEIPPSGAGQQGGRPPWEQARLMILKGENPSGGNVWNYRHNENPDLYTAGGKYQIVDSTWREGAALAGVDVSQWKHAIEAPPEVQEKVAKALYEQRGFAPWTSRAGGSLNPDGTLAAGNSRTLGIGPAYERARQLAAGFMPGAGYDPASIIPELQRISQERTAAEQPLIEMRMRRQQKEEAEADEEYERLKRDRDDPALKPWTQKPPQPDPIAGLASLGSVFAALASGFSHTPGIAAMNGMAAAIDARNAGNKEQYDEAFKAWQYNSKLALERQDIQQKAYNAAWDRVKENPELGLAELRNTALIYNDQQTLLLAESGQLEKAEELNQARIKNQEQLTEKLLEADPDLKFGAIPNTPEGHAIADKTREFMTAPYNLPYEQAHLKAFEEIHKILHPATTAQTKEAEADTLAIDNWKQAHGGAEPSDADKQTPEFVRDKIAARAKQPNLNPKEADVAVLARAEFARLHGHPPTSSDADAAEMANLRVTQRQAAQGVVDDDTANYIAGEVLKGNKDATVGLARNSANVAKVGRALVRLAKEQGVGPGDLTVRFAEFTGLMQAERTLGARTANMEVPANEVEYMAPLALEASQKVDRSQFPSLNDALIAAAKGTGSEDVVQFAQATNSLIVTYAKFLNPTGVPTDADKARATEILSTGWSQGQFAAAIAQMKREIQSGQTAVRRTREELSHGAVTPSASGGQAAAPGQTAAPAAGGAAPQVSQQQYEALPSGAPYRTLDDPNTIRVKP